MRTRVFFGLLASISLAALASYCAVTLLRPEQQEAAPLRVAAQTIQSQLEERWKDPALADRYLREVRIATGLDLVLLRELDALPRGARRARRRDTIVFDPDGHAYIPISYHDELVAVVDLRPARARVPLGLLRTLAIAAVAVTVLLLMAYLLSRRLTRALEQVTDAANRFGAGDLSARATTGARSHASLYARTDVSALATAFDAMAERVEHLVASQRSLLFAISHELRSPLGRARVALEIANDRHPAAEPEFARVTRELVSIDSILNDLLATARTGLSDLRPQQTEVAPFLSALLGNEFSHTIECPEFLALTFDRVLVGRALINCVQNAQKYGHPPQLPLRVVIVSEPQGMRVVVEDSGPGFDLELLKIAFEPFVRGSKARTPAVPALGSGAAGAAGAARAAADTSVGLGLTLVRRIAEAHGGEAGLGNHAEGGARVWFSIKDLAAPALVR